MKLSLTGCKTMKSPGSLPESPKLMPTYQQNQPPGSSSNSGTVAKLKLDKGGGGAVSVVGPPELGFVLDRSGSMASLAAEAVTGFNTLLGEQRAVSPSALFSLSLFDHEDSLLYDAVPLAEVPELTSSSYVPRGGTALNDAVAAMIRRLGRRAKRSTRVLIAILTDGSENASREASQADLLSMIAYRRSTYDWQFVFIGPADALDYALSIGIPKSNVVSFNADPAGIRQIMLRLSKSMAAYQLGDRRYSLKLHN
jgi:hypothetical protein